MADRPSDAVMRAQQLLKGGALGGHLAAVGCIVAFAVLAGRDAALSSAIGAAGTLVFYMVGLGVQVAVADAPPRRLLMASVLSYLGRVGVLGGLAFWMMTNGEVFAWIDATAIVVTTIAVVLGWLAAEIRVYARLRIPVFDPPAELGQPGSTAVDDHP
ncbi:MAG: hypothetical protein ACK5LN_04610 [Propioniciclava sp.]